MWKVYGNVLETADIDGTTKTQAMAWVPNSDIVLRGTRTWFVMFNSPVFTQLRMRLYESQGSGAGKLIATSTNFFIPADLQTDAYALKGVYFDWADIALKGTNTYYFLPYATGYTGNDSTHIAWVKAFPDPEYRTGFSLTYEEMHARPYRLAVIGADL